MYENKSAVIINKMFKWWCFIIVISFTNSQNSVGNLPTPFDHNSNDYFHRLNIGNSNSRTYEYMGRRYEDTNEKFPNGFDPRHYSNINLNYPSFNPGLIPNDPNFRFMVSFSINLHKFISIINTYACSCQSVFKIKLLEK